MTALKFAELAVRAGFPKGVVNILPGKGYGMSYMYIHVIDINRVVINVTIWYALTILIHMMCTYS